MGWMLKRVDVSLKTQWRMYRTTYFFRQNRAFTMYASWASSITLSRYEQYHVNLSVLVFKAARVTVRMSTVDYIHVCDSTWELRLFSSIDLGLTHCSQRW